MQIYRSLSWLYSSGGSMRRVGLWGPYWASIGQVGQGGREALSKTTKLLLLDSLLQEVCIESGLLVSHNLLYSGLKKAHSKKKSFSKRTTYNLKCVVEIPCKKSCFLLVGSFYNDHMSYRKRQSSAFQRLTKGFGCPLGPPAWSIGSDSVRVSPMHICFAYGYMGNVFL